MANLQAGESSSTRTSDQRIDRAHRDARLLGELLDAYRNYLRLLAASQIDERLRVKVSPSDLVQETMLHAYRDFGQFRGHSEEQLLAWLRQILIHRLHVFVQQHVLAQKRSLHRELPLEQMGAALARSTANLRLGKFLADRGPSPSSDVIRRENAVALADHLSRLAEDHREVIVLRNLRGLSFEEVARRMSRSSGAVRMLWLRAIKQLRRQMLGDEGLGQ